MPEREFENAEMWRKQVLLDIFGYISDEEVIDEEVVSPETLNQEDDYFSKSESDDEGSDFENEGNAVVKEISRRCARKVTHNYNLRYSASSAVTHHYYLRSSRSYGQKEKVLAGSLASSVDAIEDGVVEKNISMSPKYDEKIIIQESQGDSALHCKVAYEGEECDPTAEVYELPFSHTPALSDQMSLKYERNIIQESQGDSALHCEVAYEGEECDPTIEVYELPFSHPPALSDQMVVFELPSLIAIDPRPFDPKTYVEQEIYVTDSLGIRKRVPPTNVIRWRKVTNPDGKTVSESNARFVSWSDGSLQLLIGKQAFNVSEHDLKHMHSYIFQQHEMGFYQCWGNFLKEIKVEPSSLFSDSHHSGGASEERPKKTAKVREHFAHLDN